MIDYDSLRTGAGIFDVLSKAKTLEREGKKILHFEIGQPDFPTPDHIKEAAKQALDENFTGYVATSGILELKEAIQDEIEKTRGFRPSLKQISIIPGANTGVFYALRAAIGTIKDEIIYPDPSFPTYSAVINFLNTKRKPIPLHESNEFRFNPDDIEEQISKDTKLIIINSPMNPTGSVMTKKEISQVAELAEKHNLYILTDEIYSKMIYDRDFHSPSVLDEAKERTIILDGFSKAYSMTGWRLGYIVGPESLIERVNLLIATTVSCVSSFSQKAGVTALKGSQTDLKENMQAFRKRRDVIIKGLNEIPNFSCVTPQGAFYAFPNITKTGMSSKELADHILYSAGVACLPGTIFGKHGEGFLRFSYATSIDVIKEAIENIKNLFNS